MYNDFHSFSKGTPGICPMFFMRFGVLFFSQYKTISGSELRTRYKADFNTQYEEYLRLHSSIGKITRRFQDLEKQLREKQEGSQDYEVCQSKLTKLYVMLGF